MNIQLANKEDIPFILEILKQRCDWFKENNITQWTPLYYTKLYNFDYFNTAKEFHKLYIVKQGKEIIGVFLLKEEDASYWKNDKKAYYIHHLATKSEYSGLGIQILNFIENLARQNHIECLRLDCIKSNLKLNTYYEKNGFSYKGSGEVPHYSYNLLEKEVKN